MRANVLVVPGLSRAYTAERRRGDAGVLLRAWSLVDPAEELAAGHISCDSFDPEDVVHMAILGGEMVTITSRGLVSHLSHDLTPIGAARLSRFPAQGRACSADGRHVLVSDRHGGYEILDLVSKKSRPLRFETPRLFGDEVESTTFGMDAAGEHVAIAWYQRYGGRSEIAYENVNRQRPRRTIRLVVEGEARRLAVSPRGAIMVITAGERAWVAPAFPSNDLAAEPIDVGDALAGADGARVCIDRAEGAWPSSPPATLWGDFVDAEHVALVGRRRARVYATNGGTLVGECELPQDSRPLAIDAGRTALWLGTSTGFRSVRLPS